MLLHAAFSTWHLWERLLADLEQSFDVLAPTLPGHFEGEPFAAGVKPGIGTLADGVERELDRAGWPTAHIVGSSLGGLLALELAQRGRARSVIALAPGGDFRRSGSLAAKRIQVMFAVNRAVGRRLLPRAERLCASPGGRRLLFGLVCARPQRLDPAAAAFGFRATVQCPTYVELLRSATHAEPRELDQVRCPLLLAWPARDRILPFKRYGRPFRDALPSAEFRMLKDVGHLAMLDDPAGVVELVCDFTARAARPAAADTSGAPSTDPNAPGE